MHPHHWSRYYGRRRPGRLFWFVLGAITATWVIKHREAKRYHVAYCVRYKIPQEAYPHPALNSQYPQQTPQTSESQSSSSSLPPSAEPASSPHSLPTPPHCPHPRQDDLSRPWGWGWGYGSNSTWEWGPRPGTDSNVPRPADRWDEDRKRMNDFGRQAQETFTELSEATLDSLLTTIEMLKAKLAEQKAQREKEDRELEALRQEQQRQYEEWKRQQPPRHIV